MKHKILPFFLLFSVLICSKAKANETEPNNTKTQANTLALNGNNTGAINTATDVDWWAVTTTGDGKLAVTITVSNGLYLRCQVYDNDGTTLLAEDYTSGTVTVTKDGLATGTYYVKLYPYNSGEKPAYTVSNVLTVPAQANDAEPNGTKALAKVLTLNNNKTGHINYYYNHVKDTADWYKVTTTADGRLRLTISSANGQNVWAYLFDNNGTTLLASGYTAGSAVVVNKDGLAAGTYYIRVNTYYDYEWAPYTIADSLFSPTQPNDTEPDSTKAQALTLPLNGNVTGHINYYYNNHTDSVDWYKVTTNADGRLRLNMASGNGQNAWAYLFDNDGKTLLASGYTSGNAVVVNKDGLAAGTYYIRVNTYYTNEWVPYTLSDSLFSPIEPNDVEPDSTRAQALVLPLNGSKKGHINYYYNNHKDSVDWYKVTTNADGRLRLNMASGNGQNVWAYLFDNDGKTVLASGYTTGNAVVVNKDGLAAGTYYIRVNTFYTGEWAPYTLSDSLFKATPANDAEPDNNKAQALVLPLNGSANGHTNYYYNLKKDTADWYSLTTTADGMITISIQSYNGQNVWAYLFDNDGTTVLASAYTTGTTSYTFDGLKAGTYYVRVNTYYSGEWAPYTLSNTLTAYSYSNDQEPNNYFKQAKTLPANSTVTGHVNFYYNGASDAVDYHKIYYSGSGNLTLQFNQQNRLKYGSADYTWLQVYKDTSTSPVFSNYFTSTSGDINLTGLTHGYYYLKIYTYYNGIGEHFSSYSITNKFTQTYKARIITVSYSDTAASCSSINTITYKLSGSHIPYTVQLYRFGIAYGSPLISNNSNAVFSNLPSGSYYATIYGDGATGSAKGKSDTISLMPSPAGPKTTGITATQAKLNWSAVTCADYYLIQYQDSGSVTWDTISTIGNVTNYLLKGLTASTTYNWQVAAVDSGNRMSAISLFTKNVSFKTKASPGFAEAGSGEQDNLSIENNKLKTGSFIIAPNPASSYFIIHHNISGQEKLMATLYDVNGKAIWASGSVAADALNNKQVMVNQLGSGFYYLKITNSQGLVIGTIKVVISK